LQSASKQIAWDKPIIAAELFQLMERHEDNYNSAGLLAAAIQHSSDQLRAFPI
jgi:hypothetical protein